MKYVEVRKNEVIITVGESFSLDVQDDIEDEIKEFLLSDMSKFTVDMSATKFMDSSGLGVLVDIKEKLKAKGGELILKCVHGRCMEVFENTFLVDSFTFID
jgi:anti-anti-sigma factor